MEPIINSNFVAVKMLDFIDLHPEPIHSIYVDNTCQRIYIARKNYSDIYAIKKYQNSIQIEHLAQVEACSYFIGIDDVLVLFKPFEAKIWRNERWEHHSFTTQLLNVRVIGNIVWSFHEKETIQWHFGDENFSYRYLHQNQSPYHLSVSGTIVGYGKDIQNIHSKVAFTCCSILEGRYVFVGDETGALHIYDWKYLAHLKTVKKHEAPILSIKVDSSNNTVYFSGSDSKVSCIKEVNGEWQFSNEVRGQSHDILALQLTEKYLISAGVTTDLCFYALRQNGELVGTHQNKVSYSSRIRTANEGKYIVVNKVTRFEVWQMASIKERVKLIVEYQMAPQKLIKQCKISKQNVQDGSYLIIVVTEQQTVGWKFHVDSGLSKYVTIKNNYVRLQFIGGKNVLLALKENNEVEKIFCKTGKIDELFNSEVNLATDFKLLSNSRVLIGSRITQTVKVFNYKTKKVVSEYSFKRTYSYIEELDENRLLIKYLNDSNLYQINIQGLSIIEKPIIHLPAKSIRFGGWLNHVTKQDQNLLKAAYKRYWYGVSDGKIIIVTNLAKQGKQKKIRVKQTDRISQVIQPTNTRLYSCNLGVVPLNFKKMIEEQPILPVFTKKII